MAHPTVCPDCGAKLTAADFGDCAHCGWNGRPLPKERDCGSEGDDDA